ncbi:DEAD/DEAH box helicase [Marinitoga lauensis]|uniref:DEAD/DEAH box helicase n=1 Tax=Marinitoga lauensis TaxID=2201189 RepID=UPI00101397A4|nr:DEAD/DEAH box helicase [Marinitoga lauensis]
MEPAVENQATDRVYRIGQTKPVFVYKFITKNSIEEKILKLKDAKLDLYNLAITEENHY